MLELLIITFATDQDREWLSKSDILISKQVSYYCGEPCITVFPSKKQMTILNLKFSERLTKVPITSREQIEILNPANLSWPM